MGSMLRTSSISASDMLETIEMTCTSLIILMAIQLLPPSTKRSNKRGASGRKSCGRLHPSSHTTLTTAAVTLGSSLSSSRRSLILGQAGRSVSGYTKAKRYNVTMVFLRTRGCEWPSLGSKSDRRELAMDGLITCGIAIKGKDIVGICGELRSFEKS